MPPETIGILHPGAMGSSVAASALSSGHQICYASEGRSDATRARAAEHHLRDLETLSALCAECSLIISICPPHAAEDVASQIIAHGFKGLYLDANAISPQKAKRIGEKLSKAGIIFVDGSIIGGLDSRRDLAISFGERCGARGGLLLGRSVGGQCDWG